MELGIVYFGLPPIYNRKPAGDEEDKKLSKFLHGKGYSPHESNVRTASELETTVHEFRRQNVRILIICLRNWTRISLIVHLVRTMGIPAALYARTGGGWNGITALTAASAVLLESPGGGGENRHVRFKEGMEEELLSWLRGTSAYLTLRSSRVMCWGGHYGADMPYTRSDADQLENTLIAEVMTEQESVLVARAEDMMQNDPDRIDRFLKRLQSAGLRIERDGKMITDVSLMKQCALYLSARDRLKELAGERIAGVSIKCHFELSTTGWGCTACFLPAFLPFCFGEEGGESPIIPVACEGDVNGLIGLALLHAVNPDVPPLFGDFVAYADEHVLLRNCGSSSVYWAGLSMTPENSLGRVELLPNMHGKSGAAVHYETPAAAEITACRLFRFQGELKMMLGKGRIIAESEGSSYSDPWPHTRVDFGVDTTLLFEAYPCNHSSLTMGDLTLEIETFCTLAGIEVLRMDSETELETWKDRARSS